MATAPKKPVKPEIIMWCERYLGLHYRSVPIEFGTKECILPGWPDARIGYGEFEEYFTNGARPKGLALLNCVGPDNPADLDIDDAKALVIVAKNLIPGMPKTPRVFGRTSKPRSHFEYHLTDSFKTIQFEDNIDAEERRAQNQGKSESERVKESDMLVEIRGEASYTVAPPSLHPSGERVEWEREPEARDECSTNLAALEGWTRRVAVATLIARRYPPMSHGHEFAMAFSGWLGVLGWSEEAVTEIVVAAGTAAEDPDVRERRRNVKSTFKQIKNGEPVTQLAKLEEVFGPKGRKICSKIADWLALPQQEIQDHEVLIEPGELPAALTRMDTIFQRKAERLRVFEHLGLLVRLIEHREQTKNPHGVRYPAGTTLISALTSLQLEDLLNQTVGFLRHKPKKKDGDEPKGRPYKVVDCPKKVAQFYHERASHERSVSVLRALISAPIIYNDGAVLAKNGYDPDSGFFMTGNVEWLEIKDAPTKEDAIESLEALKAPFDQFPFVNEHHRSVHLVALATGLLVRLFPSVPIFAFDAPEQRYGKTLMASSVSILALATVVAAKAMSKDSDELRKSITSILWEGSPIINLDNIEGPFNSPMLAAIVTGEMISDRILGVSKDVKLNTRVMWLLTGNNLVVKGDLKSRTLACRIEQEGLEAPETRTFKIPDLMGYLKTNRRALIQHILTILKAYYLLEEKPNLNLKNWGGFDDWCRDVRDPFVWAGCEDPCGTRAEVAAKDPDEELAFQFLTELRRAGIGTVELDGARTFLTSDVIEFVNDQEGKTFEKLKLAVAAIARDGGELSSRKLGRWFQDWNGRFVRGLRLTNRGKTNSGARWHVAGEARLEEDPREPGDELEDEKST
jgi:hypothetical protein